MKQQAPKKKIEDPRIAVVRRIHSIAELIRQHGTTEEADEAVAWEKKLEGRLREIEQKVAA